MGRYARRKGKPASCKGIGRRGGKTKTKTRDLDQINKDLLLDKDLVKFTKIVEATDDEKTAHSYCIECARYFQSEDILINHQKSKQHKQRVKKLKDWPSSSSPAH